MTVAKDNAIFGFATASAGSVAATSSNNATDATTVNGTSGLANLVAGNQLVNITLAALDVRLKLDSALIGAGVNHAALAIDALGAARIAPPAIGALESMTSTPTAMLNWMEASDSLAIAADLATSSVTGLLIWTEANDVVSLTGRLTASATGTITTPVLKNNTGTILKNETGVIVNVYNALTGALVVQKAGLTSNTDGIVAINDAFIVAGTSYAYEVVLSANRRRLPLAVAT